MKRQHKHAALIQQWLDDDSLIVERKAGDGNWYKQTDCFWNEESEYRFKPKMIRCGDLEFPEPMQVAPPDYTEYWVVSFNDYTTHRQQWHGAEADFKWLKAGRCQSTYEGAMACITALQALLGVKP